MDGKDGCVIAADDPVLGTAFATEMLRQMRAIDRYGIQDGWPPHKILDPFILTVERRRAMPVIGDPDEDVAARVRAFFNGIAAMIEQECGLIAVPLISLTHEGFGRAMITVGKLVAMDRTLRDIHRFGFLSLSKMKDEADKHLSVALALIGQHPAVAGL
ncbi:MAG: NifX-associated nitrogen fixation protein [Rhodospirillaceae bacterium]|nr:NifX-associated nitrogen fixation protein [Rhodospirillaceae bacterium]